MQEEAWEKRAVSKPFAEERKIETGTCDSCEKDFPKIQLTRVVE